MEALSLDEDHGRANKFLGDLETAKAGALKFDLQKAKECWQKCRARRHSCCWAKECWWAQEGQGMLADVAPQDLEEAQK